MRLCPTRSLLGVVISAGLLATACSSAPGEPTQLAMVPEQPSATSTVVPTTAPVEMPTPAPTSTSPPPTPAEDEPTPTATAALEQAPAAAAALAAAAAPAPAAAPAVPTATPASAATATAIPAPTAAPTATAAATAAATATAAPTATAAATATAAPTATKAPTVAPTATSAVTPAPAGEGGPPGSHVVTDLGHLVFGQAGSVSVVMPAALVEVVGFHQASHPGSQSINSTSTGLRTLVLSSRGRGTPARSAADIVVPPGEPLRAPVTGTVVSATQYVLYCQHQDKLVYIEPDGFPGWQVRMFHVTGDIPAVGTRVIAGETIVATGGANQLPFESQVDEFTAEPSWPHVHVEVVDTNVPDTRPGGGGC